jgi:hypothetical protein
MSAKFHLCIIEALKPQPKNKKTTPRQEALKPQQQNTHPQEAPLNHSKEKKKKLAHKKLLNKKNTHPQELPTWKTQNRAHHTIFSSLHHSHPNKERRNNTHCMYVYIPHGPEKLSGQGYLIRTQLNFYKELHQSPSSLLLLLPGLSFRAFFFFFFFFFTTLPTTIPKRL